MSNPSPSKISRITDWLISECKACLKEHQELLDPDDLFENPAQMLAKGWGLVIGEAENTERCLGNQEYYYRRGFTFVLTRDAVALQSSPDLKREKAKLILEDLNLLLKRLAGSNSITVDNVTYSFAIKFERDSGPRNIVVNGESFNFIELTVSAEYRETL